MNNQEITLDTRNNEKFTFKISDLYPIIAETYGGKKYNRKYRRRTINRKTHKKSKKMSRKIKNKKTYKNK